MITQKARYALHVMLHLARREGASTANAIAEAERIPRKYLEHVMSSLKSKGLVTGKRGPSGGYVLARAADRISVADVLRAVDGPLALAPCASLTAYAPCPDCQSVETCKIRPILLAVRDTTSLLLEGTSLAAALGGTRLAFF